MSTISEKLREAMDYASQRSSVKQSHAPDGCCAKHISKAMRKGDLDTADSWYCPKCECPWAPRLVNGFRYWEPTPVFEVWHRR